MSAETTPTTASPVEFVRNLPPEEKGKVLLALLREAMEDNGDAGVMPIDDEDGKPFGYYVPPKAAAAIAERELPKLSPERERELRDRLTQLHTAIPMSQAIAELKLLEENLRTR